MTELSGAIGIDLEDGELHALYLRRTETGSSVRGYGTSRVAGAESLGDQVLRVVRALDVGDDVPVALAWDESSVGNDVRDEVMATLADAGIDAVVEDRAAALHRAGAGAAEESGELVACDIPAGLWQAHPHLTTAKLAGAAGGGLKLLGLGAAPAAPVATWSADDEDHAGEAKEPAPSSPTIPSAPAATAGVAAAAHRPAGSAAISDAPPAAASSGFRPWMLLGVLGLLIGAGIALSLLSGGDEPSEIAQPVPTATVAPIATSTPEPTATPEPTVTPEPTATPEPEPTATPEPTPPPAPTATVEPTPDPADALPPLSELPERAAIFRPPTLFLQGPMPDQQTLDAIYGRAVEVLGEDNVVNEYFVHPDSPPVEGDESGVRVEAAVLFQTGSAAIAPDFTPVLELAVTLFQLNPQMTAVVQGHTDSIGGADFNQRLSELRASTVAEYLVSRGVEAERLSAVGFGPSRPIADNATEAGRQFNRRIEFDLEGLLDPRPA